MAKRRANGEGSFRQLKNGRWEVRYHDGYGKRQSLYGKTRAEVDAKLKTAVKAREDGLPTVSQKITTEAFLNNFLDAERIEVRPSTFRRHAEYARIHTLPTLGRIPLSRVTPQHLQALYAQRLDAGYSPTTVAHLHAFLHKALAQATLWGVVPRNVADLVKPPRFSKYEMRTLDAQQVATLLETLRGHRLHAVFVIAVTTGMRLGELLALRWPDIDLANRRLAVRGTLTRGENGLAVTETKTGRARQIMLTASAVTALQQHRNLQNAERLRIGSEWTDLDLVFTNELGRPIQAANLTQRVFHPALKRAGLPRIRFHDLRHTSATLMLGEGVHPKVVSEMLGHSQISITLDTYSHVTPTMQERAVEALEGLLGNPDGSFPPPFLPCEHPRLDI